MNQSLTMTFSRENGADGSLRITRIDADWGEFKLVNHGHWDASVRSATLRVRWPELHAFCAALCAASQATSDSQVDWLDGCDKRLRTTGLGDDLDLQWRDDERPALDNAVLGVLSQSRPWFHEPP